MTVTAHKRSVHETSKTFCCRFCNGSYVQMRSLVIHMEIAHGLLKSTEKRMKGETTVCNIAVLSSAGCNMPDSFRIAAKYCSDSRYDNDSDHAY